MAITITLNDELVAGLESGAKKQQLSVERFAIGVLNRTMMGSESATPREVAAKIQATASNPAQFRPAMTNLDDVLQAVPGESCFDLENWNREWSVVEAEMKAVTRANEIAEACENVRSSPGAVRPESEN